MATSEQLLQLIARLQSVKSVAQGRHMLLEHLRKVSGAPLAIIFTANHQQQTLDLLAYSGHRPQIQQLPLEDQKPHTQQSDRKHIPRDGVFWSVLLTAGTHVMIDLYTNASALYEERSWAWPGGSVILNPIKVSEQLDSPSGLLALCFQPETEMQPKGEKQVTVYESDLLICSMLLSVYLSRAEEQPEKVQPVERNGRALIEEDARARKAQMHTLPEMMYSLSSLSDLYELGGALEIDEDAQDLYQRILLHLGRVVRAQGACLMLYHPTQQRFFPGASSGERPPCAAIASSLHGPELEQQMVHDSGETLLVIQEGGERVLLVTLKYRNSLKGVVALTAPDIDRLLEERGLLLSYMGNVAALILHNYEVRTREQEAMIDQERKRIAFDIHDGPAQRITHALQKLDLIRRSLEKSPASPETLLAEINRAHNMLELSLEDLRQSISSLLPARLEEQGFVAALSELLDEMRGEERGLEIACQIEKPELLPPLLEGPVYRFIQESLNNVRKHANATRVTLRIRILSGSLIVEVSDNGRGFQLDEEGMRELAASKGARSGRLGLHAMRERIQALGGSWEAQSKPGEGTILRARFPLAVAPILLTEREREVLRLIVEGLTNRAIAQRLSVSVETVKSHVHHIMQKMQVKDRTQAAVIAARQHWLY